MPNLVDITIPLTEIEIATLVRVGGTFARRLAYQRDKLQAEVQQLREDNAALVKQWNDLDQRTERQHREWTAKMLELQDQNQKLNSGQFLVNRWGWSFA